MTKSKSAPSNWSPRTVFRPIGYCLLALAIVDVIDIIYPPQFLNPNWEFQVIGQLVERVAVPLIALALIFYGENRVNSTLEIRVLKFLRWFSLLLGIIFLLLFPLILVDTPRLDNQINSQISQASTQQLSQLEQIEKLAKEGNDQQVKNLAAALNRGQAVPDQNLPQVKERILTELPKAKQRLQQQSQATLDTNRKTLLKNAIKYAIGALISGILFIYIWRVNR
jgi:predicted PurR-regulated permease PerM